MKLKEFLELAYVKNIYFIDYGDEIEVAKIPQDRLEMNIKKIFPLGYRFTIELEVV